MHSEPSEEEERDVVLRPPNPITARQCTVLLEVETGAEADPAYPVGVFEVPSESGGEPASVACITITEVEGRLLVAVPFATWHRVTSKRILPQRALSKPVVLEATFLDRADSAGGSHLAKFWVGILAAEFEDCLVFDTATEFADFDYPFAPAGPFVVPVAETLVEVAEQHFAFLTATSAAPEPPAASGLDQRLAVLERSVGQIADNSLKQLAVEKRRAPALRTGPSQPAAPAAAPRVSFQCPPGFEAHYGGIDPEVVNAAKAAGIPQAHIEQMISLAQKGKSKMQDLPLPRGAAVARPHDPLSESEGDDVEVAELAEQGDQSAANAVLTSAVAKLTQIAGHLAQQKKADKSLDALLDGVGSGSSETSAVTGSRRYAAALRALRRALQTQPQEIYKIIEGNMEQDFNMQSQVPGSAGVQVTARAWLEMRSRVQNFQTPVRMLWGIAGALNCLRAQKPAEARARLALLLCQGDQLSIDRGSWILAGEMALEEPPPLAQFAAHSLPQENEAPYTRLVDGRWVDLFLQKLNDYDSLAEKKRKLTSKRSQPSNPPAEPKPAAKGEPKKKGKGKGKQQGSGDGGAAADGEGAGSSEAR